MKRALMLAASMLFGMTLMGCQSTASDMQTTAPTMKTIEGTLAYRERIALPSNAVITVTLQDVSLADAPAKVLAKQQFESDGAQVPFDFSLSYNSAEIQANHRYSVSARIEVDGKLRFVTDTMNAVITDPMQTSSLNLMMVGVR